MTFDSNQVAGDQPTDAVSAPPPVFDALGGAGTVITDARTGSSKEMTSRIRRYTITMAFRTACFLSMIVVHGPFRWVLFACAVFLPYIAVLFANQANTMTRGSGPQAVTPIDAPQLTAGEHIEVITGQLVDDDPVEDDARDGEKTRPRAR